mgnify:CR=1 FL=1
MLAVNLQRMGIETSFVDATQADAFAAAIRPTTRAIFAETLGNPSLTVLDIQAIADVAHAHGLPLVVDNTVPSPYLCNPIEWGADIVVHSATKYLGGHGTTLAGVVRAHQAAKRALDEFDLAHPSVVVELYEQFEAYQQAKVK